MQSSIDETALHIDQSAFTTELCPALNYRVLGFATCSLPASDPHVTHRMLDDDTGETLIEWPADNAEIARAFNTSSHCIAVGRAA